MDRREKIKVIAKILNKYVEKEDAWISEMKLDGKHAKFYNERLVEYVKLYFEKAMNTIGINRNFDLDAVKKLKHKIAIRGNRVVSEPIQDVIIKENTENIRKVSNYIKDGKILYAHPVTKNGKDLLLITPDRNINIYDEIAIDKNIKFEIFYTLNYYEMFEYTPTVESVKALTELIDRVKMVYSMIQHDPKNVYIPKGSTLYIKFRDGKELWVKHTLDDKYFASLNGEKFYRINRETIGKWRKILERLERGWAQSKKVKRTGIIDTKNLQYARTHYGDKYIRVSGIDETIHLGIRKYGKLFGVFLFTFRHALPILTSERLYVIEERYKALNKHMPFYDIYIESIDDIAPIISLLLKPEEALIRIPTILENIKELIGG